MWANLARWLVIEIVIPLVKDGIFMLINAHKIRQLREQKEAEAKKKVEEYEAKPSDDSFGGLK